MSTWRRESKGKERDVGLPRESTLRARVRRALAIAQREHRKLYVQVVGDRWPEDQRSMGQVVAGPWFDAPPFERDWASRAEVGDFIYVSGHTRLQRIR